MTDRSAAGVGSRLHLTATSRIAARLVSWTIILLSASIASAGEDQIGTPPVIITEVLSHSDPPYTDAIELHNPTEAPVDIGGWWISDSLRKRARFRIPDGTVIGPGDYVVYCQDSTGFPVLPCEGSYFEENNPHRPFSFGANGDDAYLFVPDAETCLPSDVYHGFEYGTAANEVSFGRHSTSLGEEHFPPQAEMTFGTSNVGPRIGPIIFSEILYDPGEGSFAFVELVNIGTKTVHLVQSKKYPRNLFRILGLKAIPGEVTEVNEACVEPGDCEQFVFPRKTKIRPGEVVLLIPEALSPAEIRSAHGGLDSMEILRFGGDLDRSGQSLRLVVPETFDHLPEQYFIELDSIDTSQDEGWPEVPPGYSLERRMPARYDGDPESWHVGELPGGSPGRSIPWEESGQSAHED